MAVQVKDGKFDARKTWGRVFGGIKLAAILATAVEEFVDKGAKRAAKYVSRFVFVSECKFHGYLCAVCVRRLAETHFVLNVAKGDSFGEPGLLQRKPREYFLHRIIVLLVFTIDLVEPMSQAEWQPPKRRKTRYCWCCRGKTTCRLTRRI